MCIRDRYYAAWNVIVNQEIQFEKRVMHPPDNMINSLISFVNTLIYTKVLGEIYHTQLNPTISYLHEPGASGFHLSLIHIYMKEDGIRSVLKMETHTEFSGELPMLNWFVTMIW